MQHSHLTEDPRLLLAKAVEKSAGMEVTCTRDCEVLSEELRSFDGRFPVSVSTLRRFFGLIPRTGHFSTTTLNSLARYIGYSSYKNWQLSRIGNNPTQTDISSPSPRQFASTTPNQPPHTGPDKNDSPKNWSEQEAKRRVKRFIERFADPNDFHLTSQEFDRLKNAVFAMYERGTFDMALWLAFIQHKHLLQFVVEQFPPLDFLSTFGKDMMTSYLRVANTPAEITFGNGVLAAGMVARDEDWAGILPMLKEPGPLNPSVHPLAESRNLGILLLACKDGKLSVEQSVRVRELILDGLERDLEIWPRWANQNCYFALNMADWAVLSEDLEIIQAVNENIRSFRERLDWYQRNVDIDTLLSIREVWNCIFLGERDKAIIIAKQLRWNTFLSMETRTLGLWYHGAKWVLELEDPEICRANMRHCTSLTLYKGFERRVVELAQRIIREGL